MFKSQEEALADGTHYTFCVLCTKCLPDVRGNAETLAPTINSGQVSTYLLIQVGAAGQRKTRDSQAPDSEPACNSYVVWDMQLTSERTWRRG